jgi:hypothetical protein
MSTETVTRDSARFVSQVNELTPLAAPSHRSRAWGPRQRPPSEERKVETLRKPSPMLREELERQQRVCSRLLTEERREYQKRIDFLTNEQKLIAQFAAFLPIAAILAKTKSRDRSDEALRASYFKQVASFRAVLPAYLGASCNLLAMAGMPSWQAGEGPQPSKKRFATSLSRQAREDIGKVKRTVKAQEALLTERSGERRK